MEGNTTFAKLTRVVDRKHLRPSILAQLYTSAFEIMNQTSNLTYLIAFAQVISTMHKISLISLNDVALLSHIEVFKVVQIFLSYMNPDQLLRRKDQAISLVLVCVALFICLLTMSFLFLPKRINPTIKRVVYRSAALLFSVGLPMLDIPIYLIFISQIDCWNASYHDQCWTLTHLTIFILSAIGIALLLTLTAVLILFFYVDNFVLTWPLNGSAKLLLVLKELEKILLALIYIVDKQRVFQTQMLVVLTALFIVKLYMEYKSHAFYEMRIARVVLFMEAFYFGRLLISLIVRFSYKSAENWTFAVIFISAIVMGSLAYMYFIEHQRLRDFAMVSTLKDEAYLIDLISRLVVIFRHQSHDHNMHQKLINFFAFHVDVCHRPNNCSCRKVLNLLIDNNLSEHKECRIAFFTFLTEVIVEFQMSSPKTMNLYLIKAFIEFVELGKIIPVAFQMKFIQSQKFGWNGLFNIFILEYDNQAISI